METLKTSPNGGVFLMEQERYWKLFSKTGTIEDYLKFAQSKNAFSEVKVGEIFSGGAGDKGKEYRGK